jgi:NAD(P)H dehydrogenase (quinone)
MILVTGITGQLGGATLRALHATGATATGSSRAGGEANRRIDFDEPSTVDFSGVDTLVLISAGEAEDDVVIGRHETAIAAAERDGVTHLIYTSVTGAGDHLAFATAHRWTERRLRSSTLSWTIMRNGLYAELFGSLLTRRSSALISAFGDGELAAVAREDLADAAAVVAADPARHAGRVYELVGEPITAADIADRLGMPLEQIALETRRGELLGSDLKPFQPPMLMSIYTGVRHGFHADSSDDLRILLGRPLRDGLAIAAAAAS